MEPTNDSQKTQNGSLDQVTPTSDHKILSGDQLNAAENNNEGGKSEPDDTLGKGYTGGKSKDSSGASNFKSNLARVGKNKKVLVGGSIGAGLITAIIFGFFAAASLKLDSIVTNLQNRFMATSENAVSNETQNLFTGYIKTILPSYRSCGVTKSKNCSINIVGSDPISNLYRAWSNARLENTLASKYGIEFSYDTSSRTYYLKAPGVKDATKGDPIGSYNPGNISNPDDFSKLDFELSSRTEVRQTINTALKNETAWKQVFYRFKVGRLLEQKYGIKRCIIACTSIRDPFADFVNEKKNAMQIYLVQRVITPRSLTTGLVLQCLLVSNCDTQTETSTDTAKAPCQNDCELNGAQESPEISTIRTTLAQSAADFGIADKATIQGMIDQANSIEEKGYSNYILETLLSKVGLSDLAIQQISDSAPIIGWVNTASSFITHLQSAGPKIKALSYAINAAAAVSLYQMYRTYVDEAKTGRVNATEYGSFVNALGPGNHGINTNDAQVGGSSGAEGSPLYSSLMGGNAPSPNVSSNPSLLSSLLSPITYAISNSSTNSTPARNTYLCSNNQPPQNGNLVCPEEVLGAGNSLFNSISQALSTSPLDLITAMAHALHSILGRIFSAFGNFISWLIQHTPGLSNVYSSLTQIIGRIVSPFERDLVSKIVTDPFGTNMSGGRTFDMMAAGADVSGNTYAHHGLGGVALTPAQANTIVADQENQAKQDFQRQPLFARLFSTTSPYSLISRFANDLPIGASSGINSIIGVFTDPFSHMTNLISSIVSSKVSAFSAQPDPFGVTQYGYPPNTIPSDPQTYWNQNCADTTDVAQGHTTTTYNSAAGQNIDPTTGQPENIQTSAPGSGTDPCLLIQAAVGSAGGLFKQSLLTPSDLADSTGNINSNSNTNASVYEIGDSLSVGMQLAGLSNLFTSKGYSVNQIEANSGYNVAESIPKLQIDAANVRGAGKIVVELGTDNCYIVGVPVCMSTPDFETQIQTMMQAIRNINSTAQVYWVNIYTTKGPEYKSINQALSIESTTLNFTVIDWAKEAIDNPSKYMFDPSQGIHQETTLGYQNMANFIIGSIGGSNQTNVVAQAIDGSMPHTNSSNNGIWNNFGKVFTNLKSVFKLGSTSLGW